MKKSKHKRSNAKIDTKMENINNESESSKIFNSLFGDSYLTTKEDPSLINFVGNPIYYNNKTASWQQYVDIYRKYWEAQKIIDIPVYDALRNRPVVSGLDEKITKIITDKLDEIKFWECLKVALINERLLGGAVIYIGFEDYFNNPKDQDILSIPIDSQEQINIKYLSNISLNHIQIVDQSNNVLSPNYNNPSQFLIDGKNINKSRLIIFRGDNNISYKDYGSGARVYNNLGFGESKLEPIWYDIAYARTTRNSASRLVDIASIAIAVTDNISGNRGTREAAKHIADLKNLINNLSNDKGIVLDSNKISEIKNLGANFGSIPDLITTYLKVLSAASDVPASRFLGEANKGLNSTGDGDLENYYNVIDSYQKNKIEPIIKRIFEYIGTYFYGKRWQKLSKDITITFPPLWNESQNEQVERETKHLANVDSAVGLGVMSLESAQEEINKRGIFLVKLENKDIDESLDYDILKQEATNFPEDNNKKS